VPAGHGITVQAAQREQQSLLAGRIQPVQVIDQDEQRTVLRAGRVGYPGRGGGPWLRRTLVPSGLRAVVVPSGFSVTVQPHWWMAT
jgi:hypothetical protein